MWIFWIDDSPPPNSYDIKSVFSRNPGAKAWSFGIARESFSKVLLSSKCPGLPERKPNTRCEHAWSRNLQRWDILLDRWVQIFNASSNFFCLYKYSEKLTFSILGFLGKAANGKQESPGPGQYENREVINQRGSYFLAKYKNSGAPAFNPPNSKRFKHYNNNSVSQPGPGHYTPKTDLPSTGEYFVSKYQGSMCRTFYHSDRTTLKIPKQSQGKQCL